MEMDNTIVQTSRLLFLSDEILINILHRLDYFDLILNVRAVCCRFNNMISKSGVMASKLFRDRPAFNKLPKHLRHDEDRFIIHPVFDRLHYHLDGNIDSVYFYHQSAADKKLLLTNSPIVNDNATSPPTTRLIVNIPKHPPIAISNRNLEPITILQVMSAIVNSYASDLPYAEMCHLQVAMGIPLLHGRKRKDAPSGYKRAWAEEGGYDFPGIGGVRVVDGRLNLFVPVFVRGFRWRWYDDHDNEEEKMVKLEEKEKAGMEVKEKAGMEIKEEDEENDVSMEDIEEAEKKEEDQVKKEEKEPVFKDLEEWARYHGMYADQREGESDTDYMIRKIVEDNSDITFGSP